MKMKNKAKISLKKIWKKSSKQKDIKLSMHDAKNWTLNEMRDIKNFGKMFTNRGMLNTIWTDRVKQGVQSYFWQGLALEYYGDAFQLILRRKIGDKHKSTPQMII